MKLELTLVAAVLLICAWSSDGQAMDTPERRSGVSVAATALGVGSGTPEGRGIISVNQEEQGRSSTRYFGGNPGYYGGYPGGPGGYPQGYPGSYGQPYGYGYGPYPGAGGVAYGGPGFYPGGYGAPGAYGGYGNYGGYSATQQQQQQQVTHAASAAGAGIAGPGFRPGLGPVYGF